ncbi:FCD domain-containing protein [Agarivorans gilvus]|nr:FCD domain-containing protein [Agarivorans gilvus]
MKQTETKRRYYEVGLQIEELLFSGVFKAGARLPSERELSERFDTSRATVREAIIMLELKGLVTVRQGAGIFFTETPDSTTNRHILPKSDIGPFELLQARQIIESNIAAFASTQIKFSELRELKQVLAMQESEINGNSDKFEQLDQQFHVLIAESTQNRVLINQAVDMWSHVRTANPLWNELNNQFLHEERLQTLWIDDHKKILLALQKRSPTEARNAVWQHIENSKQELLRLSNLENTDADTDDFFFAVEFDTDFAHPE